MNTKPQGQWQLWLGLRISVGQVWDVEPVSCDWKAYSISSWLLSAHLAYPEDWYDHLILHGPEENSSSCNVTGQGEEARPTSCLKWLGNNWKRLAITPDQKSVKRACYGAAKYLEYSPLKPLLNLHTYYLSKLNLSGFCGLANVYKQDFPICLAVGSFHLLEVKQLFVIPPGMLDAWKSSEWWRQMWTVNHSYCQTMEMVRCCAVFLRTSWKYSVSIWIDFILGVWYKLKYYCVSGC